MAAIIGSIVKNVDALSVRIGVETLLAGSGETVIRIATVSLITLLTLFVLFIVNRLVLGGGGGAKGDTVLIAGPTDGGKTTLFYRLLDGSYRETVSSMTANASRIAASAAAATGAGAGAGAAGAAAVTYQFVDFPGHLSQRLRVKEQFNALRGLIFVVDINNNEQLAAAAGYLFSVLTDHAFVRRRAPVAVVTNKCDLLAASTDGIAAATEYAQKLLPFIQKHRAAMTVPDTSMDGAALKPLSLGSANASDPFDWSQSPVPVTFIPASVATNELSSVRDFITRL